MRDPLAHRVAVSPDRTALVDAATGTTWDFDTLDGTVDRTAARFETLGVSPGDRVAVVLPNRPAYVTLVHAGLRAGTTLVPVSHRLTAPELRTRLDRVAPTVVVCDDETRTRVTAATDAPVATVDGPGDGDATALATVDPGGAPSPHDWSPDETALLLFTSGTTGDPKPVVLTPTNLLASAAASALRLGLRPDDRWLGALPFHHAGGLAPILRMPLYGSTVVLERSFEPGAVADDVGSHGVTCASLVPTMLRRMLDARGTLADALRVVLLGGAPAPEALIERCRDYSVSVYPTYGTTETATQVATATPGEAFADPGTVGRPLFGTEVRVVDGDGEERPPGEPGELVVSGPTVSPGYLGLPDATAAAFGDDGFNTGDVGVVDPAGRLRVLNRADDRIVTGGENVDPGEVVAALCAHPAVADAAVVGRPDEEWGERVAALVVPEGERPDRNVLDAHCRDRLAGFKVPEDVAFADELPRTVSGTVDRDAVRQRIESGGADGADEADGADDGSDSEGWDEGSWEAPDLDGTPIHDDDRDDGDGHAGGVGGNPNGDAGGEP